ncbi:MAG: hypothetical protein ACREM6_13705 [Vulcanimicrobiaceae bacterium]
MKKVRGYVIREGEPLCRRLKWRTILSSTAVHAPTQAPFHSAPPAVHAPKLKSNRREAQGTAAIPQIKPDRTTLLSTRPDVRALSDFHATQPTPQRLDPWPPPPPNPPKTPGNPQGTISGKVVGPPSESDFNLHRPGLADPRVPKTVTTLTNLYGPAAVSVEQKQSQTVSLPRGSYRKSFPLPGGDRLDVTASSNGDSLYRFTLDQSPKRAGASILSFDAGNSDKTVADWNKPPPTVHVSGSELNPNDSRALRVKNNTLSVRRSTDGQTVDMSAFAGVKPGEKGQPALPQGVPPLAMQWRNVPGKGVDFTATGRGSSSVDLGPFKPLRSGDSSLPRLQAPNFRDEATNVGTDFSNMGKFGTGIRGTLDAAKGFAKLIFGGDGYSFARDAYRKMSSVLAPGSA